MAFQFNTSAEPQVEALSPLQMAELNNELMEAYEGLTDSMKELDDVQDIMENIQTSQMLLAKYGKDAIPQLNLDKGLEALCKIPESMLTAEKAVEGLGDKAKEIWTKFIAIIKDICSKLVKWIKSKFSFLKNATQAAKTEAVAAAAKASQTDVKEKTIEAYKTKDINEIFHCITSATTFMIAKLDTYCKSVLDAKTKDEVDTLYKKYIFSLVEGDGYGDLARRKGIAIVGNASSQVTGVKGLICIDKAEDFFPKRETGTPESLGWDQINIKQLAANCDTLSKQIDENNGSFATLPYDYFDKARSQSELIPKDQLTDEMMALQRSKSSAIYATVKYFDAVSQIIGRVVTELRKESKSVISQIEGNNQPANAQ